MKPRRKHKPLPTRDDVTPERAAKSEFISAGMAHKAVPAIMTMWKREEITAAEYHALSHFRDQASLADKSPVKSCIDFSPKGGHGPGVAIISAIRWTHEVELALSQHGIMKVVRAITVDDQSLWQFCIAKYGARDDNGTITPRNRNVTIPRERMSLRYGAGIIAAMIGNIRKAA